MSLETKGEKCVVCQAYLFPEDDIIYCPECGAPHHRDCYTGIGHCALEQEHGTDKQYQRPQAQESVAEANSEGTDNVCGMCGEKLDIDAESCENCGAPNISKMGGRFIEFDFLGGVPADMDLGSGVTADEAKMFVGANTQRYIPKFAAFKAGKKASWNWAAFLVPCPWLLSRKMYAIGALVGALQVAFTMLQFPFNKAIAYLDFSNTKNYFEISNIIMENMSTIGITVVATAFVGVLLNLILRIILGSFGDLYYKKRVISEVAEIKTESEDVKESFRRKGGFSFMAAIIGIMAVQYLPSIIAMFM